MEKKNKGLVIIIVILSLLLIAGGIYILIDKGVLSFNKQKENITSENETNKEQPSEKKEEVMLSADSVFVKDLIERYDKSKISSMDIINRWYKSEKTLASDQSLTEMKADAIFYQLGDYFTSEQLHDKVHQLYGPSINFTDETFEIDGGCSKYIYNNGQYSKDVTAGGCGGTSAGKMVRKILSAKIVDEQLYIVVAVGIDNGMTENVEDLNKNIISSSSEFDIEKDYDRLSKYEYQFIFDKENYNYYLQEVHKI